jgi:hypothetical protein
MGRDTPCSAVLATARAGWAANCRMTFATSADGQEGDTIPFTRGRYHPQCKTRSTCVAPGAQPGPPLLLMMMKLACVCVALAESALDLGTGTTAGPTSPA